MAPGQPTLSITHDDHVVGRCGMPDEGDGDPSHNSNPSDWSNVEWTNAASPAGAQSQPRRSPQPTFSVADMSEDAPSDGDAAPTSPFNFQTQFITTSPVKSVCDGVLANVDECR